MRLSASSLNTLTKCAYKYFLTEVQGLTEPGKKKYNMLLGDIVGDAVQWGCLILNRNKTITDYQVAKCLYASYVKRFYEAGIPPSILEPIKSVLLQGESPEMMMLLDSMSISINMSIYEFTPPPPLKGGKVSMNKKKPPFCMKVVNSLEALMWFFEPQHEHYALIQNAAIVQNEKSFSYKLQERTIEINGEVHSDDDYITGRFDTLLLMPDGSSHIFELKYTNTPYTQDLVNRLNQFVTYFTAANQQASVWVFDITERRYFLADITDDIVALVNQRYRWAVQMLQSRIYMPACGTDPYNTAKMLCGFKCGGCAYGSSDPVNEFEMEEVS